MRSLSKKLHVGLREVVKVLSKRGFLRVALLPEERVTPRERKLIEQGRREIEKGRYVTLDQLRKELGP